MTAMQERQENDDRSQRAVPYQIGVGYLGCRKFTRNAQKSAKAAADLLIVYQNRLQKSFSFSVIDFDLFLHDYPTESGDGALIDSNRTLDRKKFWDATNKVIEDAKTKLDGKYPGNWPVTTLPSNWIVFTEVPFTDGYYGYYGKNLYVCSLATWNRRIAPPSALEFVVRMVQRACLCNFFDVRSHYATRGCVADYTEYLMDARLFVLTGAVCTECETRMREGSASDNVVRDLQTLLDRTWFGGFQDPGSPASLIRKLYGYDVYVSKSIEPRPFEGTWRAFWGQLVADAGKRASFLIWGSASVFLWSLVIAWVFMLLHFSIRF
uniref:Uncharacterized protein n=1 Tax=mine drainage metagenome TaxID=410659 RepID=E6Q5P7_9ZZZZ